MNPEEILAQAPDFLRALADALEAIAGGAGGGAEQAPVDLAALAGGPQGGPPAGGPQGGPQ